MSVIGHISLHFPPRGNAFLPGDSKRHTIAPPLHAFSPTQPHTNVWKGEDCVIIVCVLCYTSRAASAVGDIGSCWSLLFEQASSPKFIHKSLSKFDKFATQCYYLFQKQQTWDPLPAPLTLVMGLSMGEATPPHRAPHDSWGAPAQSCLR